ncbi:tyrosine-protein phosphatase [Halanaerobaculum tunisiense]
MIDLHAHILPNVDDGAEDIQESLAIAKEAESQGIEQIVATPHYVAGESRIKSEDIRGKVAEVQKLLKKEEIDVEILPGAELYLTPELPREVHKGQALSINDSRYLLVELPMTKLPDYVTDTLYDLQMLGYTPVVAHPERYPSLQKNPNRLFDWVEAGMLAQLNAGSLLGKFGSRVQETAEILVQHNLVQVVGSDLHATDRRRECLAEGTQRLKELGAKPAEYFQVAKQIVSDQQVTSQSLAQRYQPQSSSVVGRLKQALGLIGN